MYDMILYTLIKSFRGPASNSFSACSRESVSSRFTVTRCLEPNARDPPLQAREGKDFAIRKIGTCQGKLKQRSKWLSSESSSEISD